MVRKFKTKFPKYSLKRTLISLIYLLGFLGIYALITVPTLYIVEAFPKINNWEFYVQIPVMLLSVYPTYQLSNKVSQLLHSLRYKVIVEGTSLSTNNEGITISLENSLFSRGYYIFHHQTTNGSTTHYIYYWFLEGVREQERLVLWATTFKYVEINDISFRGEYSNKEWQDDHLKPFANVHSEELNIQEFKKLALFLGGKGLMEKKEHFMGFQKNIETTP